MTFRETLDRHLSAIQKRDLQALADTVTSGDLVLVSADGQLVRSAQGFLDRHRGWFEMTNWHLEVTPVQVVETPQMGIAVLHLTYHETPEDMPPIHQQSYLTLVFQQQNGKWLMVLDQNTPMRRPAEES